MIRSPVRWANLLRRANTAEARLVQLKARIGIQVLACQNAVAKRECEEARPLLEAELSGQRDRKVRARGRVQRVVGID